MSNDRASRTALWLLAAAACTARTDTVAPGGDGVPIELIVAASYPSHGPNWNDYVRGDGSDAACDAAIDVGCRHSGELRRVTVTDHSSCVDLSIEEDLGAFDWSCDDSSGTAAFVTTALRRGVGLRDLLDADGWRPNRVRVRYRGALVGESQPVAWWSNRVTPLPDNSATAVYDLGAANGHVEGEIFTLGTTRTTTGYNLNLDKMALVTLAGANLSFAGGPSNCDTTSGEIGASTACLVAAGSQDFLWVEVNSDGGHWTNRKIYLHSSRYSVVNDSNLRRAVTYAIYLDTVSHSVVQSSEIHAPGIRGLVVDASDHNVVEWVRAEGGKDDTTRSGFLVVGSDANRFVHISAANSDGSGFAMHPTCEGNVIYDATFSGNAEYGFVFQGNETIATMIRTYNNGAAGSHISWDGNDRKTLVHVTAAQNNNSGLWFRDADWITLVNLLSFNNGGSGLYVDQTPADYDFYDLWCTNDDGYGIYLVGPTTFGFFGSLWVGANGDDNCRVVGGTDPGLIDATCTDTGLDGSNTYAGQESTAVYRTAHDIAGGVLGKVDTDDSVNPDDDNGQQALDAISDWINFEGQDRYYGPDGGAFPTAGNRGRCASVCRIWDMRVRASHTEVRDAFGTFVAGEDCPASVHGDQYIEDQQVPPNAFLIHAVEVMLDHEGDDDGLCESNESCIFAPNLGAYQGEGDYRGSVCTFQASTTGSGIVGVTMHGYPVNGR